LIYKLTLILQNFEDNIASNPVSCNETDATKLELDLYEELSLIGLGIGPTAASVSLDPFMVQILFLICNIVY
jgi:hypothetical protein